MICLSLTAVTILIWFRFLKSRLPKDIPFSMLVLSFFVILCSTMVYAYIIYRLLKPSKSNKLLKEIQGYFLAPLKELNNFLLGYHNIENVFIPVYKYINNISLFYLVTNILPRIITVIALFIDIFMMTKFQYTYKVIYITLVPLVTRYFIYSLSMIKDHWITMLSLIIRPVSTPYVIGVHPDEWPENQTEDTEEYDILPDFMNLPLDVFIPYQINYIVSGQKPPAYHVHTTKEMYKKYRIEFNVKELMSEHLKIIDDRISNEIEKILSLAVFILSYEKAQMTYKYLRNIKIILYASYIICWSYFLYLATPKVIWISGLMSLLHTLPCMEDPFGGYIIFYDLLAHVIESNDEFMVDIIPMQITYK